MDAEKQLRALLAENELLLLQLEDANRMLKSREEEISMLGDSFESAASLQSKIDNNQVEIAQCYTNLSLEAQKKAEAERASEELENDLLAQVRKNHTDEKHLLFLNSEKAELAAMNEELSGTADFYPKLRAAKAELAEAKSKLDLALTENVALRTEIRELRALVATVRGATET